MYKTNSYQQNMQFISRSFTSKEELVKQYKKLYNEKSKAKELYQVIYSELKDAVSQGNINNLKNVNNLINYVCKSEDEQILRECYNSANNPIKRTNLVILACQHNKLNSLKYLFSNDCSILSDLSLHINKSVISPCNEDETCHNAFYYAICSGNAELLNVLINEWPNNYFSTRASILDTVLSEAYEELKLKNVPLSNEIEIYVENKLLDLRFFSDHSVKEQSFKGGISNIKGRIDLVLKAVDTLNVQYSDSEKVDGKYIFILKFIAQNIHILKRQLKFTYDRLPWEEIEFCLICFVSTYIKQQEINLFYCSILDKGKIINHLKNFTAILTKEKDGILESININKLATLPNLRRDEVVHKVISHYPQFELLYKDYEQIRDVYSLERINHYIKLALSADVTEREGQLIITRALQVTGENIKNTLESPKLSNATSELLLLSLPENTRQIIINLRNSLSHAFSLSQRTEIEKDTDVNFFSGIQNDIKKVGEVISDILYSSKIKALRMLLETIINSNIVEEVKKLVEVLKNADFTNLDKGDYKTTEHKNLIENIEKIKDEIEDMTVYEKKLFNDIDDILKFKEVKMENNVKDYILGFASLKSLSVSIQNSKIDSNYMRTMKYGATKMLENIKPKEKSQNLKEESRSLKEIAELLMLIFSSVTLRMKYDKHNLDRVNILFLESFFIAEFAIDDIKWIKSFRGKLNKSLISTHKSNRTHIEKSENYRNHLTLKLSELKEILKKYALSDQLAEIYPSYETNEKLQAVIEMLVLDIMSILDTSENRLENNVLYLDKSAPILTGKSLRNHLAHDNVLLDILFSNINLAVILNAKKLTEGSIMSVNRKLGKFIRDDVTNLKNKYNKNLTTISIQDNMFNAVEEGNISQLKTCMKDGADICARDINLWNSLQLATKGPSLNVVKFILDHNFSLDIKDNDYQSLLHIAAAYGRKNYIKLLLKNVDDLDDNGKTALHIAAQKGHTDIVEILLNSNADNNIQDMLGFLPVHYAVMNNNIDIVKILLEKEKSVDSEAMNGFTLLHLAAEKGHLQLVDFLLENNADVNRRNERQTVPLHLAALNGYVEIVNALLLKGAEVNAEAYNGCIPLHYAVETNRVNVVELLLKYGANVNAFDNVYYNRPLHYAAQDGREEIVKILLKHSVIADVATVGGATPLHLAVIGGFLNIVSDLVNYGADIDSKDFNYSTPLHYAAQSCNKEIADFLIKNNANVNSVTHDNVTPLHVAAEIGCYDVADFLIKNGSGVNGKDIIGRTPLHMASLKGCDRIADLLIKSNANINAIASKGITPIYSAALQGHENIVVLLIKNKADISSTADGLTLLQAAVMGGNKNIVNILIKNGVPVNAKDIKESTPLHIAVDGGHKEIVEVLIANGADITVKYDNNQTLFSHAVKNNYKEIVKIFLANGANVNEDSGLLLHLAVFSGHKDIVLILLRNNADTNVKGVDNTTPLHIAAKRGFTDIVNVLVNNGANVNAVTNREVTPLFLAASGGFEEIVELLLNKGAAVNKGCEDGTPLHIAAVNGHSNIVKILLSNKADVNMRDAKSRTPLEQAVAHNHLNVVIKLLQSKEIDINRKGNDNFTVLHIACQGKNLKLVEYLTSQGCDINAKNTSGSKPIHIAAREGSIDIVEFLLNEGLTTEDRGIAKKTLLHYAASKSQLEMVKYLIRQKADVNATDINGVTPMHIAAKHGGKLVTEALLNNGAIYNAVDIFERRPLEMATDKNVSYILICTEKLFKGIKLNDISEVQEQIKAGACINARNAENGTPLHFAAWKGYEEIVNILLDNQANPNSVGINGLFPLHYAVKFSHLNVVTALLRHGAIYNAISKTKKTPLDLSENKHITNLLNLVSDSFTNVKNNNCKVISNIKKVKEIDIVRAVMGAYNEESKSLIVFAMCNNFSKVDQLKEVHQGHMSAQIDIALAFAMKGNYQQSLSTLKTVLEKRKEILGPDDPGTLDIQTHIAKVLYKQGLYHEALNIYEGVFQKQKEILGCDNKYTLSTRSSIALIFHRQGRDKEALNIFREVIPKQKEILGPDDSDTLDSQFHMALSLHKQGDHEEALAINKIVFEKRKATFGEYNPATVSAENNIAMVLASQGKNEEALKIYKKVLEKKKMIFGVNHSDTLRTMQSIAAILTSQRKYKEALKAHEEVLSIQENVLGKNHLETISCQYNMANTYFFQGKFVCAIKGFKKCFDKRDILGPFHPIVTTISSQINMIKLKLNMQGDELSEILQCFQDNINSAVSNGDITTVQRLLKCGADVTDKDTDGRTPLHFAVDSGHTNIVKVLLKNGADVTEVTNKGNTPLHLAASKGHLEIIEILLQHVSTNKLNEFLNARTSSGRTTSLHVAAKNSYVDIVKCLLKYGAIYNAKNKEGKTPISMTKDQKVKNLLKLIEDLFEDVKNGNFRFASKVQAVKPDELIALTNARNNEGSTLLQVAIINKHKDIARKLLDFIKKADHKSVKLL